MKASFYLISLAFFCCNLSAQETFVRVDIGTNKKCLYSEFTYKGLEVDSKNSKVTWTGGCKDGFIHGFGTLTRIGVDGDRGVFKGEFVRGLENGLFETRVEHADRIYTFKGTFINGFKVKGSDELLNLKNGKVRQYFGEYVSNKYQGNGELIFKGEATHKGTFYAGKLHGPGQMIFVGGSYRKGIFGDGKLNGRGEVQYEGGTYESGNFSQNKLSGNGYRRHPDGSQLTATFVDGVAQGYGVLLLTNGESLSGNLVDGEFDGRIFSKHFNLFGEYLFKNGVNQGVIPGSVGFFQEQRNDSYKGSCPCPYSIAIDGSVCGNRSAYSRSGGASPKCY